MLDPVPGAANHFNRAGERMTEWRVSQPPGVRVGRLSVRLSRNEAFGAADAAITEGNKAGSLARGCNLATAISALIR